MNQTIVTASPCTHLPPRLLISVNTGSQNLAPSPPSPAHNPEDVAFAGGGNADGHIDGPVGDLTVTDLDVNSIDEHHRIHRSSGRLHQSVISPITLSVIREIVSFDTVAAVDVGEVRRDLPGRQTLRRQRQYDLVDPCQSTLTFLDDLRIERASVSRGTSISTGPISVSTVLARVPLRELPCRGQPGRARHSVLR